MAKTTATVDEIVDSLTGHDELSIHAAFGKDITEMAQFHRTILLRACIAIDLTRSASALNFPSAAKTAMDMRMGDVAAYFPDEDDAADVMPGEPESESGKDD